MEREFIDDELQSIRVVLLRSQSDFEQVDALHRLGRLGRDAAPLIHMCIDGYMAARIPFSAPAMVRLLDATGDQRLLAALRKKGDLSDLGYAEAAVCLKHGAGEVEGQLLALLWQAKARPDPVMYRTVVPVLGEHGSRESLETLTELSAFARESLAEQQAKIQGDLDEDMPAIAAGVIFGTFADILDEAVTHLRVREQASPTGYEDVTRATEENPTGQVASEQEDTRERWRGHGIAPDTPFRNKMALRELLSSARQNVRWYEQHLPRKALEVLLDCGETVSTIRLLSGPANVTIDLKDDYKRFQKEMKTKRGVDVEWRILARKDAADHHDRVLFADDTAWNLPPLNTILKGSTSEILLSGIDSADFETWWALGQDLTDLQPSPRQDS